jgi:hypothetical protein
MAANSDSEIVVVVLVVLVVLVVVVVVVVLVVLVVLVGVVVLVEAIRSTHAFFTLCHRHPASPLHTDFFSNV